MGFLLIKVSSSTQENFQNSVKVECEIELISTKSKEMVKLELYSEKNLLNALSYYDLPFHEDIAFAFKNREQLSKKLGNYEIQRECIETILYSLDFKKYREYDISAYHFSYVMTIKDECLFLMDDIVQAEEDDTEALIRLVPFAKLEYGNYLCFYFKDFDKRPEIVLWDNEESEPYNAYITSIASDLDKLVIMAQKG